MTYEKQFHQRKHRGGETVWFLRLDTASGSFLVRSRKTTQTGVEVRDVPPDMFISSGNRAEHRKLASAIRRMPKSLDQAFEPTSLRLPIVVK